MERYIMCYNNFNICVYEILKNGMSDSKVF